jgi:hypothetical protein
MPAKVTLAADTNQALGIAQFAIDFMSDGPNGGKPDASVLERANQFHTDAVLCGISAISLGCNAPNLLRREALEYATPSSGFGTMGGVSWAKGARPQWRSHLRQQRERSGRESHRRQRLRRPRVGQQRHELRLLRRTLPPPRR